MISLGAQAPSRGPVAQLGARVNGIHEVTGSIPVWSTIPFASAMYRAAGRICNRSFTADPAAAQRPR